MSAYTDESFCHDISVNWDKLHVIDFYWKHKLFLASRIKVAIYFNTILIQYFNQNEIFAVTHTLCFIYIIYCISYFDLKHRNLFLDEKIWKHSQKVLHRCRRYIYRENITILCPREWCKLEKPCHLRAKDMRYITGKTWYKHVRMNILSRT